MNRWRFAVLFSLCTRERGKLQDAEYEREKLLAMERARQCRADAEEADLGNEPEWRRRPYRDSRRAAERRRKRQREEHEDEADRRREETELAEQGVTLEEQQQQEAVAGPPPPTFANGDAAGAGQVKQEGEGHYQQQEGRLEGEQEVKSEPEAAAAPGMHVDTSDPIYQAMMAAARAPPAASPPPTEPTQQQQQAGAEPELLPPPPGRLGQQQWEESAGAAAPRVAAAAGKRPSSRGGGKSSAFGDDEEEEQPKRQLVPIQYSKEEEREAARRVARQDPRGTKKGIIDTIPTTREGVFAYNVDWSSYDEARDTLEGKVRGYVNKKMVELLGEEEETLVGFIIDKLRSHAPPPEMLEELRSVLDTEADGFVLKLYRLVIYETECFAKLGPD